MKSANHLLRYLFLAFKECQNEYDAKIGELIGR